MLRRIVLFIVLNFCVMLSLSLVVGIFGLYPKITAYGFDWQSLAIFCLVWGMGGAFISLALSRCMAKWLMKVKIVEQTHPLVSKVRSLSMRAGLKSVPQIGVFESDRVNAFATGPSQKRSLVALSTGLLEKLEGAELDAVIGHELSHIKSGDMVTMTLLQGVVNAFVMFLARFVASVLGSGRQRRQGAMSYYMTVWILEFIFMIFGAMLICWYSRKREFRADAGGAAVSSKSNMIAALRRLQEATTGSKEKTPASLRAMMIRGEKKGGWLKFFATHPPIEERIAALQVCTALSLERSGG